MNLYSIEKYVDQTNRFGAILGQRPLSLLIAEDRQKIANKLDSDLSPEHLTCDGEVRGAQLKNKYNYLVRCVNELRSIDPSVTFYEYN